MNHLLFKKWLLSEMANYGYGTAATSKIKGGTEVIKGEEIFKPINPNEILNELIRLPSLGPNFAHRKWEDMVVWGEGLGAIHASATPLGSIKIIIRRKTIDLLGEDIWLCKHVFPLFDVVHSRNEIQLAHLMHDYINEVNQNMVDSPKKEFENFSKLANNLWNATKRDHPSYIMFPTEFKKMNEDYYKIIFEFRGHGVIRQNSKQGRAEQFDIDLFWDRKKGLIRCWGYNIDSSFKQHSWEVQPSEWDEWFAPTQDTKEITECITKIFLKY